MARRLLGVILVSALMVLSAIVAFGIGTVGSPAVPTHAGALVPLQASSDPSNALPSSAAAPPTTSLPSYCSSVASVSNNPGYAAFVSRVQGRAAAEEAEGLPVAALHLPYAGPIEDQTVGGVPMAGSQLTAACDRDAPAGSQTAPTGVAYDGQIDTSSSPRNVTLDANSVAGILRVNSPPKDFYPGSATPTVWGAQENVVLPNVTLFGHECPVTPCSRTGQGNYAFWIQNVVSYDSQNASLYMVDDTWNFTSYSSSMFSSSLVGWSPTGSNYTGVWVAYSQYYHVPTPFTVIAYVNTSVDSAGDQVLWYNYSIQTPSHFVGDGSYDYLVFHSQPLSGPKVTVHPPDFEASAITNHVVTEGYEFDAFIGADDGSNQLMLGANATMQVQYCVAKPYCTPSHFAYANVPAAVNFGSQTGEWTVGIAVNYVGARAYLSGGPLILHGLWNYTGSVGVASGNTKVLNSIRVTGDPEGALATQPYVFVFFENKAFSSQGFQWAPDVHTWYLMPGVYRYEVMLADYNVASGHIVVGSSPVTLSVALHYNDLMGVYTPLWAFGNGQLAGISTTGDGTRSHQYIPFNNPTTGYGGTRAGKLNPLFFSFNDYFYPSFPGVLISGTTAYVDLNSPPTFSAGSAYGTEFYLGLEFFETSHLTLAHDTDVQGWPAWGEISFYFSVPASQNPMPQAEVFVWNSTHDLIASNRFVGTTSFGNPPDALVLYGGTDNVVWDNTFTNARGASLSTRGQYAGLGLGEGGDLIYNNNFSVDNPVVYLPYNWPNVADCLPQSLGPCANNATGNGWYYNDQANVVGNIWNVTPQPAGKVSDVVNGFKLTGNVLGPGVATQGGNYYWNYGTGPNGYWRMPYVSRFYYSDWSYIFPLGCGSIQAPGAPCGTPPPLVGAYENGIQVRGDYAPYGPSVVFTESGLAKGSTWSVTIHGLQIGSTSTTITVELPYGNDSWHGSAPGWTGTPASGYLVVNGVVVIHIAFTLNPAVPSVLPHAGNSGAGGPLVMRSDENH
jgi:thermopsin